MHGSRDSTENWLDKFISAMPETFDIDMAIFPPFVFLDQIARRLASVPAIRWGAQTMNEHASGAFTGEISPMMLQDFGCDYVLVGHSERRQHYHESSALIAKKFVSAQKQHLKPILCVGETREHYLSHQTKAILQSQLDAILNLPTGIQLFKDALIAYEPIWAIGTGDTATPELAQSMHHHIRHYLASFDPKIAESARILYGGSVKKSNAADLLLMPDIDGLLVGGASLDVDEFIAICQQASEEKTCNS